MSGTVYLVGAGPGDPGLITHRGLELLRRADVVIYDRLASRALLRHAPAGARLIDAGKDGRDGRSQKQINRLLERHALKGRLVVRLKGGDPFIFGRGGEEAEYLASRGLRFEIVPGVTAAVASAAYAGVPLTHRDRASRVTFITGILRNGSLPEMPRTGTVAIYMAVRTLPRTMQALVERGWDPSTPAVIIEWGTTPRQRLVEGTITTIADEARRARIRPPAVAIAGSTVTMRGALAWFEKRPLAGLRVAVTRSRDQARELGARLAELGADAIECPTLEIEPVRRWSHVDAVLRDLSHYDAVVLTSQNAVGPLFERLHKLGRDARAFAGLRVAAVGPATRDALARRGLRADWVAEEYTTAALARRIASELPPGARVLHPGADRRSPHLETGLRKAGVHVRNLDVYRLRKPRRFPRLKDVALVTFASAQTVRNFASLSRLRPPAACIGPVTAAAARALGFRVVVQPRAFTIPDLVDAIVRWRAKKR